MSITIVGLGPVGLALARALAAVRTNYRILGHDRDGDLARAASRLDAFDKIDWNLVHAVEPADLVFLRLADASHAGGREPALRDRVEDGAPRRG